MSPKGVDNFKQVHSFQRAKYAFHQFSTTAAFNHNDITCALHCTAKLTQKRNDAYDHAQNYAHNRTVEVRLAEELKVLAVPDLKHNPHNEEDESTDKRDHIDADQGVPSHFCQGGTFVGCSHVCVNTDLVFIHFSSRSDFDWTGWAWRRHAGSYTTSAFAWSCRGNTQVGQRISRGCGSGLVQPGQDKIINFCVV